MAVNANILSCAQFTNYLVSQEPFYDRKVLKDIRPIDSWVAHLKSGTFEAWSGTQHTRDRYNSVYPDTTNAWRPVSQAGCLGTPCDKVENRIGMGASRLTYGLEEQNWATDLFCFDQIMSVTKAQEMFDYWISKVLKPVAVTVQSDFARKRVAQYADNKYIANRFFGQTASNFTFNWVDVGDGKQIYIDTNAPPTTVFKLTPQMLQRLVDPLIRVGALGESPFGDKMPEMLELVTDEQTKWELDHLGGQQGIGGIPSIAGNWRFTDWSAASKFWQYGFSGTIGNFAIRTDPMGLRFNYVGVVAGLYRYQVVKPYKNVPSSGAGNQAGIKSVNNADFDNAQFAFSYIFNPMGVEILTADSEAVNPAMPFARRNWAGQWKWVMDNLGADINGCVIENKRHNKGQFIADFKQAIAPNMTEFLVLMFHRREPSCVIEISACNADPGYPTQSYSSANGACIGETSTGPSNSVLNFPATLNAANGDYRIAASSFVCEGSSVSHGAISGSTTIAALVIQLNAVLGVAGTWTAGAASVNLTGTCSSGSLPFLA